MTASRKLRIIRTLPRCETELRDSSYTFLFVFWPKNTHVWLPTLQASGGLTVNLEGLGFPRTRPPLPSMVSDQDFVVAVVFLIDWKNAPVFTGISLFLLVSELQLVVKDRIYLWNTGKKAKERQTEKNKKPNSQHPVLCRVGLWEDIINLREGLYFSFFSFIHKISSSNWPIAAAFIFYFGEGCVVLCVCSCAHLCVFVCVSCPG